MPRARPDPAVADALAPVTLASADGSPVRLGDLWAETARVLIHLRHFG